MRITFITSGWRMSGGDRVIAIYADQLRLRGHEVLLVAPPPPLATLRDRLGRWRRGGSWSEPEEPTFLHPDVPRRYLEQPRPVENGDVPDADVVIATWWETAEWVATFAATKGAKVSFLQHYEAFQPAWESRVAAVWRLPFHKITISNWLVDLARTRFGDSDVSLVYNSVDTKQFHAPPRDRASPPTIGFLYHDTPWKGLDVCLATVAKLHGPVKVTAFGSQVARPGEGGHAALPSGSRYYFRPPQNEIRDIYAQCDVWLCGSRGEGFHLPPLEAMACRCPIVSTAVGGPLDVVEDGVNGFVVPVDDVEALTDRVTRVIRQSTSEWRRMSDSALQTATRYTWDDATDRFEEALHHAVQRRELGEIG